MESNLIGALTKRGMTLEEISYYSRTLGKIFFSTEPRHERHQVILEAYNTEGLNPDPFLLFELEQEANKRLGKTIVRKRELTTRLSED